MTKIRFFKNNGNLYGFEAVGHSGAGAEGEDIVCAAISSVTQYAAVMAEEVLGFENSVEMNEEAYLSVKNKSGNHTWYDIVKGLEIYLTELQKLYPDNLKVTYTEV